MSARSDKRGDPLTDMEAIFGFVLGIVKLTPEHTQYQSGGHILNYEENDNIIELQLLNPKKQLMFQGNISLEELEEGVNARVFANWPTCEPTRADIKAVRVGLRKMLLAIVHHDHATTRHPMDCVTYIERFI